MTLRATPFRDSLFEGWTFVLTINNENPDQGAVVNGAPGGEGIDCGLDGGTVEDQSRAVERAYMKFDMSVVAADPALDGTFYVIASLGCGGAVKHESPDQRSGSCEFGNTEGDRTITVSLGRPSRPRRRSSPAAAGVAASPPPARGETRPRSRCPA